MPNASLAEGYKLLPKKLKCWYVSKLHLILWLRFKSSLEIGVYFLLQLLLDPLLSREVKPDRVSSMDQIDLAKNYQYLIRIKEQPKRLGR